MKRLLTVFAACFCFAGARAAAQFMPLAIDAQTLAVAPAAPQVEAQPSRPNPPASRKAWTVMIYMNGNGGVPEDAISDFDEIENAGSGANLNVVTQIALGGGYATRHYVIKNDIEKFNSPELMRIPNADMGSYQTVADFVNWAKANYPADKYALVFWTHGMGFVDPPKPPRPSPKAMSFDKISRNYITTPEIGLMLGKIGRIDLVGLNSCLMQMAEVVYEMKDNVGVVVGSEENVHGFGFNYAEFLSALEAAPSITPEAAGVVLAEGYYNEAVRRKIGAQVSVIRPAALPGIVNAINEWVPLAKFGRYTEALKWARDFTTRFGIYSVGTKTTSPYGDMGMFIKAFVGNALMPDGDPDVLVMKYKGRRVLDAIKKAVVKNYGFSKGLDFEEYTGTMGLSAHVPVRKRGAQFFADSNVEVKYSDLAFSKDCQWDEFIKWAMPVLDGTNGFYAK